MAFEYTGRGGIVGALIILQTVVYAAVGVFLGISDYLEAHAWPWIAGGLVSAVICWLVGRHANRGLTPRFIDYIRENGREYAEGHTFFFVRLEYCGVFTVPFMFITQWGLANAA